MPIHTVDEMLTLKSQYTQKPFANFSLSNCIARKKQGERLERGTNAWGGRHAVSVAEARTRQIQHALNKLSLEKYDEVLNELAKPEFFELEAIKTLVAGVFQKALAEPFLASLYANLCFCLARFEVQGTTTADSQSASPESSPSSLQVPSTLSRTATPGVSGSSSSAAAVPVRPKSLFRATIVAYAQTEFEKEMKMDVSPSNKKSDSRNSVSSSNGLSNDEKEALRQEREEDAERILKRKRANIKFVGHLFLVNVLSMHVMKTIVNFILHLKDTPMHCPSELDLDVLTILLTTIGARIDEGDADSRQFLEDVMTRLQTLESQERNHQHLYTMRVRTKVMNLVDLRLKNWTERRNAAPIAATSSTTATPASIRASPFYSTPFSRANTAGALSTTRPSSSTQPSSATAQQQPQPQPNSAGGTGAGSGGSRSSSQPGQQQKSGSSESERSSAVGSTNFDPKKNPPLQFPDTPSVNTNNVATPQLSTPISFKTALLFGGSSSNANSNNNNNNNNQKIRPTPSITSSASPSASKNSNNSTGTKEGNHHTFGASLFDRVAGATPGSATKKEKQQQQHQPTATSSKPANATTTATAAAAAAPPLPLAPTVNASSTSTSTTTTTTAAAGAGAGAAAAPMSPGRPLPALIKELFREWLCSHSTVINWQQRFAGYGRTEEELRASIVKELVYEACLTTRQDAQVEAVMFCKQGLSFGHFDFYPGFQKILRKALSEGVLTDVPKFFDRLMIAMHYAAIQQISHLAAAANSNSNSMNANNTMSSGNPNPNNNNNNVAGNNNNNNNKNAPSSPQQLPSSSPYSSLPNTNSNSNSIMTTQHQPQTEHVLGSSSVPSVRSNRTGLFRQLSQLMFAVAESNPLDDDSAEANEEVADGLLRIWQAAPRDEKVDDSVVDFILRPRACSKKFPEMVVEMLTFGVHEAKVLSPEPVKKWLRSDESTDSPLRNLLAKNFEK